MLKESIISFETAKLAKEKGFKSKSRYYDASGDLVETPTVTENDYRHTNNDFQRFRYEAPAQSLLQKWLREEKGINLFLLPSNYHSSKWYYGFGSTELYKSHEVSKVSGDNGNWNYEEALEACLQEALKLI